ncbi:MAG: hypothetical protein GX130_12800, partial [Candidatus Hydrogenedens sp.]|nr:hypothetical protein [Candidatus Hydrogenedens sp.]
MWGVQIELLFNFFKTSHQVFQVAGDGIGQTGVIQIGIPGAAFLAPDNLSGNTDVCVSNVRD